MAQAFRKAACAVVDPEPPKPRKRRKRGGDDGDDGDRFTTRKLAADYVKLCRHPTKDLRRWLAEDKKKHGGGRQAAATTSREGTHAHDATTNSPLAYADGLRRQPLHQLRGGLDAHREGRRQTDGLLARSRAGFGRYDGLRSLREEGGAALVASRLGDRSAPAVALNGECAALMALYSAKIETTRRSGLSARDVSAAIRALLDERAAAFQALTERRRDRRMALRLEQRLLHSPPRDGSKDYPDPPTSQPL